MKRFLFPARVREKDHPGQPRRGTRNAFLRSDGGRRCVRRGAKDAPSSATTPWRFLSGTLLAGVLASILPAYGGVVLPAILSDHMVLEKSASTVIWGKADPGENISIALAGQSATAKTGDDGRWKTSLDLSQAAAGPHEMVVKGNNEIRVRDVMIGDVWLASGQSNMQFILRGALGDAEELAAPPNPMLRHFKVKVTPSLDPLDDCEGAWEIAEPKTAGDFTAVGYFFAKALQKELGGPVGIINSSLGGTASESWTSGDGMLKDPELGAAASAQWKEAKGYSEAKRKWEEEFAAWTKSVDRPDRRKGNASEFAAVDADLSGWKTLKLPGAAPGALPGARWFRRTVEVPANRVGKDLFLVLGEIEGFEEIYWNGELIGSLTPETHPGAPYPRRYDVPGAKVKAGPNVLAIRVFSPATPGGMVGRVFKAGTAGLMGDWLTRVEYEFPGPPAVPMPVQPPGPRSPQGVASALYNGMIHPILPYTIEGVIWYQGEGNASRAWQYRTAFPLLIADWREKFGRADLPFYFCQLANHGKKISEPVTENWAELREAQSLALKLPHTGQAILIDLGEGGNIHPANKRDVGERLAKIALAKTYGKSVPYSGPVMESSSIEGNKVRVRFGHTDGGLVARPLPENENIFVPEGRTQPLVRNSPDSEVEGFAICGKDGKWVWADAKIDGNDVVVWSDKITEPFAVRYAWADNPTANLYNGAGLPASPFRTDSFPLGTLARKYKE